MPGRLLKRPPLEQPIVGRLVPARVWAEWLTLARDYLTQLLPAADTNRAVWDDLEVNLTTSGVPAGASVPTLSTFLGGTKAYLFSGSNVNELFFSKQIRHRYKPGSPLYPHVHWAPSGTDVGAVTWGIEYTMANVWGTFPTPTTATVSGTPLGVAHQHLLTSFDAPISQDDLAESAMIVGRVWRDGAADASTATVFGLSVDFHYLNEKVGSTTRMPGPTA